MTLVSVVVLSQHGGEYVVGTFADYLELAVLWVPLEDDQKVSDPNPLAIASVHIVSAEWHSVGGRLQD
jgi:hypothetical protein